MLIAVIVLAIIIITLSIAFYTYRTCFHSPKNRVEDPYSDLVGEQYDQINELIHKCTAIAESAPFQWVQITSFDHLKLYGRYYHITDRAPVIILLHGYRGSTLRDCSGNFMLAHRLGFNILAVEQRGHGRSDGTAITFGILERFDCVAWANYAANYLSKGEPIVLSGLSMGAATVLMAAELSLPKEVVGILADCPYSSPKQIIKKVCKDRMISPNLIYPFVALGAKLFGRFNLASSTAVDAIVNTKIPILLYHGEDDRFVPHEMSQAIYAANPDFCELHTFPIAGHGLCYIADPIRYEKVTYNFLKNIPSLSDKVKNDYDIFFDNFTQ